MSSLAPFLNNQSWINVFGERFILQMPEDMELYPPSAEMAGAFSNLMQFTDGNRVETLLINLLFPRFLTDFKLPGNICAQIRSLMIIFTCFIEIV
ncbi:aminoglycoside 6-adenylyltransferase [Pedobacter nutrimenti]|uniref:aminoglycoside 6-adenylyltransferase n=1 Tax=Pedobacter nutrimenti TaxID=1241337 RepID=UPI001FE26211|nr:aminoglycoside 6-adenylyltransferase [Pedobacter nutrimenti]